MNPKIFDDEEMVDETMRETAGTLQEIASFMAGNKEKGNSETLELAAKLSRQILLGREVTLP